MQGWNSIGIIDLVSNQGGRPNWCQIHSVLNILLEKAIFREKKARGAEGETSCYWCRGAAEFLEDVSEGFAMTVSWKDCHKGSGGCGRGFFLRLLLLWKHTKPSWLPMGTQGVLGSPWPLQLLGDFWPPKAELGAPSLRARKPRCPRRDGALGQSHQYPWLGVSFEVGEKVKFPHANHFSRSQFSHHSLASLAGSCLQGKELRAANPLSFQSGDAGINKWQSVKTPYLAELV